MANYNFFEIRRRPEGHRNVSVIVDDAAPRGLAMMRSLTAPEKGVPANPNSSSLGQFLGFLTRPVVVGGPTTIQRAQLWGDSPLTKELELPFVAGGECSLEMADAVIAEGSDNILLSGTGAITAATALGTRCSFKDGKFYEAQANDDVLYALSDNSEIAGSQLTAEGDGPRCRFERISLP